MNYSRINFYVCWIIQHILKNSSEEVFFFWECIMVTNRRLVMMLRRSGIWWTTMTKKLLIYVEYSYSDITWKKNYSSHNVNIENGETFLTHITMQTKNKIEKMNKSWIFQFFVHSWKHSKRIRYCFFLFFHVSKWQ